jgi:hypothetical protein
MMKLNLKSVGTLFSSREILAWILEGNLFSLHDFYCCLLLLMFLPSPLFVICVSYTFSYMLSNQLNSTGEEEDEFTPGPHPDLVEDRIGLDDRVLCFHGSSFLSIWPARSYIG